MFRNACTTCRYCISVSVLLLLDVWNYTELNQALKKESFIQMQSQTLSHPPKIAIRCIFCYFISLGVFPSGVRRAGWLEMPLLYYISPPVLLTTYIDLAWPHCLHSASSYSAQERLSAPIKHRCALNPTSAWSNILTTTRFKDRALHLPRLHRFHTLSATFPAPTPLGALISLPLFSSIHNCTTWKTRQPANTDLISWFN